MQGKNGGPGTKELFKVEMKTAGETILSRKGGTLVGMPPIMQKTVSARAGRAVAEETPVTLDPAAAVSIEGRRDSAEIPVSVETSPLMMETAELREFIRSSKCVDKEDFVPEQFANRVSFSHQKNETSRGARYTSIRSDDGKTWRLYPHTDALASLEKFHKCRFVAMLLAEGRHYHLYWETPEPGQKR